MKKQSRLLSALFNGNGKQPTEPLKIDIVEEANPSHELSSLKTSDLCAFNSEAERQFCLLVSKLLDEGGNITPYVCHQEASFELNISPATAKRYLIKHTARRARFGIDEHGFVFAKF